MLISTVFDFRLRMFFQYRSYMVAFETLNQGLHSNDVKCKKNSSEDWALFPRKFSKRFLALTAKIENSMKY